MARSQAFELQARTIGALPVVNHFLDRLQLDAILARYVPHADRRCRLAPATALGLLVRNVMLRRAPVYALEEWAAPFEPGQLRLAAAEACLLNDDRVGRALDRLFDADRASLLTEVVVRAVREFQVELEALHNDSTTVTFSGQYSSADGRARRGRPTLKIAHGHNKDHRPDLKQLLWILTVSADGAVPVHFRSADGNITDDVTHIQTWQTLCRLVGRPDFLYVADCKLCTKPAMSHIAERGGRFLTVLPRTRREDAWFRDWVHTHSLDWQEAWNRPHARRPDGPRDHYRVVESPIRSAEGYRLVWVWSESKTEQDQLARQARIEQGILALEILETRLRGTRCRLREHAAVVKAVEILLSDSGSGRWLSVTVSQTLDERFHQERRGRPGPRTRYVRQPRMRFQLHWQLRTDTIEYDARTDGMFPLITNDPILPATELLHTYKYQPRLEKRHEQLKSVHAVAPVFLKNVARIEALLLIYFFALLTNALIERELRRGMNRAGLASLALYPEERLCRAPTTDRVLELLQDLRRMTLYRRKHLIQTFPPTLSPIQQQCLALLGVPPSDYLSVN